MAGLSEHPIMKKIQESSPPPAPRRLTIDEIKALAMECGADDCGVVSIDDPLLVDEAVHMRRAFPTAKLAVSIIGKVNSNAIRSPTRSVSNNEFHMVGHDIDDVCRNLVNKLGELGISALNPPMAFPMEADNYPERIWIVSHKLVAEAAGMGKRGVHRSIIHPKFGSFVFLGTVLIDMDIPAPATALDYNPCFECKLCVVACPVGALKPDGGFDFSTCLNHNYQQFLGGFSNWVDDIVDSKSSKEYRAKHSRRETVKRWQSLSYGPNYNAAYCMAVCPAGEDFMGAYLQDKKAHIDTVLKPLQEKVEPLYVVSGSDAVEYAAKNYPHKELRLVRPGTIPTSIGGFLFGVNLTFQRGKAKGLDATYHFVFTGDEPAEATMEIRKQKLTVTKGLVGKPDITITADSATWLKTLDGSMSVVGGIFRRKIKVKGPIKLLKAFGACFPS